MKFKPVEKAGLYQSIIEQIQQMIANDEIRPGDRFPPERELQEQFGVGRSIIRQAFRVLESNGLVISRPGGGRYLREITNISFGSFPNMIPIDKNALLEKSALLDIWETRMILETRAAAIAAMKATDEEIAQILLLSETAVNATEEDYEKTDYNLQFHLTIARSTHNFMLYNMVEYQLNILNALKQSYYLGASVRKSMSAEHSEIASAIANRNPEHAQVCMAYHLADVDVKLRIG